ncbi:kelch-like 28 [Crotalus adamanteus]|uniref:Kelch-like 28 n=1 Tax=Crotalus adamanteus TaxID=8729 RepID=A0AAW1C4E3_CROAD
MPRQPAPRPPPPPPGPSQGSIAVSRETRHRCYRHLLRRLRHDGGTIARAHNVQLGRRTAAPVNRLIENEDKPRRVERTLRRVSREPTEAHARPGCSPLSPMDQSSPTYMIANLIPLHSEQLLQGLNLLRQHHELCDVILRVGDVKIHAHKVVLASISPYFKAMFSGNLSEKENSEVEFQCIAEAALQAIVEYAYTGTVFISQDTVESLLPAANLLQIKLVLKECCTFLESQLDPGNCIGISRFAETLYEANHLIRDDHTCKHLLNEALKYHFMPEHRLSYQTVLTTRPRCPPKVLCAVGGKAGLFACLESVEMYFPKNDSWIGLAPLSVPRYEFGICALDQKIYVIGGIATHMCQGINYRKHESSVECWDPDTNTWTSIENMNESRSTLGVTVLSREIYALGGYDGQSYLQSVEKYIPKVKAWQPVAPMNKTRSCFAAAVLDGMIYAIGGYGPAHMNSVERYDPNKDSWEAVAPMADKRINFGVGVMLGFIFVVGGHNGVSHLSSIERYDLHQNQWTVCHPMKEPRTGVGAAVIDTYLYVVGGHSGSSYLNTVQKYDPIADDWLDIAGMMYCRCNFGLAAL